MRLVFLLDSLPLLLHPLLFELLLAQIEQVQGKSLQALHFLRLCGWDLGYGSSYNVLRMVLALEPEG